jgi:hypothetical protein
MIIGHLLTGELSAEGWPGKGAAKTGSDQPLNRHRCGKAAAVARRLWVSHDGHWPGSDTADIVREPRSSRHAVSIRHAPATALLPEWGPPVRS